MQDFSSSSHKSLVLKINNKNTLVYSGNSISYLVVSLLLFTNYLEAILQFLCHKAVKVPTFLRRLMG